MIQEPMTWRPIETAPKNGEVILWNGSFICMAQWNRIASRWHDGVGFIDNPTHWQPLPEPPE